MRCCFLSELEMLILICISVLISDVEPLFMFSSAQSLSHVRLFVTPWTAACQAFLSIINSQSLFKLMSIELVMPSNHLILCCSLLQGIFSTQESNPGLMHCRQIIY